MLTTILSGLFLLAIGQGLFLAATLLLLGARRPDVRTANGLLAALMLLCVLAVGHAWIGVAGLYREWPHSALALLPLGFATGPLLYLYFVRILLDRPLGRRQALHFLPFALATLALLPFYLQPATAKLAWMRGLDGPPWYVAAAALAKLALFLLYVHACYRLLNGAAAHPLASGLRRLLGIWLVGGVLSMLALLLELALEFAPMALPVSADVAGALVLLYFLYATAYLAIRQPLGYRLPAPAPAPAPPPKPRYGERALPDAERGAFLARLEACMRIEEPWRDGELKLEALAERLALTPHELSQLINGACGANFQDYLNRHRVDALKAALRDPARCDCTILDLALASGFNSKSALNRVFKAHAGMTPGEFRRREGALSSA